MSKQFPRVYLHRQHLPDPAIIHRGPIGMAPFAERRRTVEMVDVYRRACFRAALVCVGAIWALVTFVGVM